MTGPVLTTADGHVAWVRLNRPQRRNAIDSDMRTALREAFARFDADPDVRVAVLTGTGTAFCAGVDQKEEVADHRHVLARDPLPVAAPVTEFSKPVIAAVNGAAVGGGLELVLACDLIVASTAASFGLPEVRIGSMPGSGGTQRLTRIVPRPYAMRMLLTGERIPAAEALRIGLVSDVLPEAEFETAVTTLARAVAANAPLAMKAIKRSVVAGEESDLAAGLRVERQMWALLASTQDREEGRRAFREHRPPQFSGD